MRCTESDHLEAHESPRGEDDQTEDGESPVHVLIAEGHENVVRVGVGQTGGGRDDYPGEKDHGEHGGETFQKFFRHEEEESDSGQGDNGKEDLHGVNGSPRDGVTVSPVRDVSQHRPDDEEESRSVQEDDRQIGKTEEPRAEKGVVPPEGLPGVDVDPAGSRRTRHQEGNAGSDDQHDGQSDNHGNDGARGTRYRQKGGAGHDEGPPADHAAEGHGPDIERGEIFFLRVRLILFRHK